MPWRWRCTRCFVSGACAGLGVRLARSGSNQPNAMNTGNHHLSGNATLRMAAAHPLTLALGMLRVNGDIDLAFPLTPSLSLGERVNYLAPLVCTSSAMN